MKSIINENDKYTRVRINTAVDLNDRQEKSGYFPDFLLITDPDGKILDFNIFNDNFLFPEPGNVTGSNVADVFDENISREIFSGMKKIRETNSSHDLEYTIPINFTNRIFHARFVPSSEGNTILLLRDVTKMRRAEEALMQSDLRFRSVWENSIDGMRLLDVNGIIVAANKAYSELVGLRSEEYLGRPFTVVYKPQPESDFSGVISGYKKEFSERGFNKSFETEAEFISGKKLFIEVFNVFIESAQEVALEGEVLLLSIFRDITERKKSENALRNSELRFRSVWENSIDGMRLTDPEGVIVAVNNSFIKLTGHRREELIGSRYTDIYFGKSEEEKEAALKKYREKFINRDFSTVRNSRSNFRTGKMLDLEVTYSIIEYRTGEPLLLAIFHDITERRRAEEELRRSETLAAIGKMAAYLSHEIKTPLASIRMNLDLITRDPEINQRKQKSLNIMQKEIRRLNRLLRNVLQYSKHQELLIVSIKVTDLINGIKDLLETQLTNKKIEFINNTGDAKISGDYQRLQSVFLHLIENSIEAIEEKGRIEIYTREDDETDTTTIFIKDNGCGVKGDLSIFEPFFTTKHTGTGLGLAIAHRIIELHKGDLSLHSSSPGETIFAVKLHNYGI
jgi:two-component system, sporulation sensor kinase E